MYEDEYLDDGSDLGEELDEGHDTEDDGLDEGYEDFDDEYEDGGTSNSNISDRIKDEIDRRRKDSDLKDDIDNAKNKNNNSNNQENKDNKKNKKNSDKKDNDPNAPKDKPNQLGKKPNDPKNQMNGNDQASKEIGDKINKAKNNVKQNNPAFNQGKAPGTQSGGASKAGGETAKKGLSEGTKKGGQAAGKAAKKGAEATAKATKKVIEVISKLPPEIQIGILVVVLVLFLVLIIMLLIVPAAAGDSGNLGYSTGGVSVSMTQKCEKGVKSTAGKAVGTTYELNEYLARVVKAELGNGNEEALKAQAVLARTKVLIDNKDKAATDVCTMEISQNAQDADVNATLEQLEPYFEAVEATNGQILTKNKSIIASYFASWPDGTVGSHKWSAGGCDVITCASGTCTTKYYKYPSGTSWNFSMPEKDKSGNNWNDSPLTAGNQTGHCHGVSQLGLLWLTSEESYDYVSALKYFYDDDVEIGNYLSQSVVSQDHAGVVQLLQQELTAWNNGDTTTHNNMIKKYTGSGIFAWCASFAHWILTEAGVYDSIGFNGTKGWTYVSYYSSGTNSQCLSPSTYNPQPGDLFIFDTDSSDGVDDYDHIGFVLEDLGDTYTTIEGNWSDALKSVTKSDSSTTCFVKW